MKAWASLWALDGESRGPRTPDPRLSLSCLSDPASDHGREGDDGVTVPQTGIFALGNLAHTYLELDLRDPAAAPALVDAVADLSEPRTTMGGVNLVTGFRPELWRAVAPDRSLRDLHGFVEPSVILERRRQREGHVRIVLAAFEEGPRALAHVRVAVP